MTKEDLIAKLKLIAEHGGSDKENDHVVADDALLEFIGDAEISAAYGNISKWYA